MARRSGDRIVVYVEDSPLRGAVRTPDVGGRRHRVRRHIVAQRLDLHVARTENCLPTGADEDIVRVDVEPTFGKNEAQSEIVAAHRRMSAFGEGCLLSRAEPAGDIRGRREVVEHSQGQALPLDCIPACEAGLDIFRDFRCIVPIADQRTRYVGRIAFADVSLQRLRKQRQAAHERRPKRVVLFEARRIGSQGGKTHI